MKIIVIGPSGAGKTCASDYIAYSLGYALVSFDNRQKRGFAIASIVDLFRKKQLNDNFVIDGFPADIQEGMVSRQLFEPDLVVYVDASDYDCVQHILGRRYDTKTGKLYHLLNNPPDSEKVKTGEIVLSEPECDNSNILMRKVTLSRYFAQPLKKHYEDKNVLKVVHSATDTNTLVSELEKLVQELKK